MLIAVNFIAFQIAWFATILGVARGLFWLGPLAVLVAFALHLKIQGHVAREVSLALKIMIIGFATDTLLTAFGVYTPKSTLYPSPYSPPWLIGMWLNFSTLINSSINWLSRRYLLAAVLGGIGGAMAYYGGSGLGAMEFHQPLVRNLVITGLAWAVLTPSFFILSRYIDEKLAQQKASTL
jgi:hypothetical protein